VARRAQWLAKSFAVYVLVISGRKNRLCGATIPVEQRGPPAEASRPADFFTKGMNLLPGLSLLTPRGLEQIGTKRMAGHLVKRTILFFGLTFGYTLLAAIPYLS